MQIERRIEAIQQALGRLGDMRPGSMTVQTRKWGGQYRQLSYTHLGKGHTEYIPENRVKEVSRQLAQLPKVPRTHAGVGEFGTGIMQNKGGARARGINREYGTLKMGSVAPGPSSSILPGSHPLWGA